jgi:hypothetical protein
MVVEGLVGNSVWATLPILGVNNATRKAAYALQKNKTNAGWHACEKEKRLARTKKSTRCSASLLVVITHPFRFTHSHTMLAAP